MYGVVDMGAPYEEGVAAAVVDDDGIKLTIGADATEAAVGLEAGPPMDGGALTVLPEKG